MSEQFTPDEQEILDALDSVGLSRREILSRLAIIIKADKSKVVEVDKEGKPRLAQKQLPKHMAAVTEISVGRIRFADPVKAIELAAKIAAMGVVKNQINKTVNDNRRAVIVMPPTLPKAEAFAGLIEAQIVESNEPIVDAAS
jgi:hypothetical protein